ncbi:hypothetical protein JCM12178A_22850 [Salidesulfovibrio brasiliensis]
MVNDQGVPRLGYALCCFDMRLPAYNRETHSRRATGTTIKPDKVKETVQAKRVIFTMVPPSRFEHAAP